MLEKNITNITKLRNCIDEFQEENAIKDVEITEEMVQKQCRQMPN